MGIAALPLEKLMSLDAAVKLARLFPFEDSPVGNSERLLLRARGFSEWQ